jgi:hypothetical protein
MACECKEASVRQRGRFQLLTTVGSAVVVTVAVQLLVLSWTGELLCRATAGKFTYVLGIIVRFVSTACFTNFTRKQ